MFEVPHEPWLVVLSIAIAIQGSFVGLSLAARLDTAVGLQRKLALAGSALTLATGIWAMHFVGMLAASFPERRRLPRTADPAVVPDLRARGRLRRLCGSCVAPPAAAYRRWRRCDGSWDLRHALCRRICRASRRPDLSGAALRRRLAAGLRRRQRLCAYGPSALGQTARGSFSAPWRSAWRSPACTTRPWPGCGWIRSVSSRRASWR